MKWNLLVIATCILTSMVGCTKPAAVSDVYRLDSPTWKSTLSLKDDGTFQQIVLDSKGQEKRLDGKWIQRNRAIDFTPFLYLAAMDAATWSDTAQETFSARGEIAGRHIVIREDIGFIYSVPEGKPQR